MYICNVMYMYILSSGVETGFMADSAVGAACWDNVFCQQLGNQTSDHPGLVISLHHVNNNHPHPTPWWGSAYELETKGLLLAKSIQTWCRRQPYKRLHAWWPMLAHRAHHRLQRSSIKSRCHCVISQCMHVFWPAQSHWQCLRVSPIRLHHEFHESRVE